MTGSPMQSAAAAVNCSSGLSPLKICPTSNRPTSGKPRSALRCAALTSAVDLVRGLGLLTDIAVVDVPGATPGYDNDYAAQRDACLRSLADRDLFLLHVEATDEAGHQGAVDEKVRSLELWDSDIEGETLLRVRVTELGRVDSVEVIESSGQPAFDSAAIRSASSTSNASTPQRAS